MRALILAASLLAIAGAAVAQPARQPSDDDEEAAPQNPAAPEAAPPTEANPSSAAYDARIRQSYAAAEAFRGKLDGGWIASARGRDLLELQLVDKGKGQVEGAWRDLRGGSGLDSSGLLDPTPLTAGGLDVSFQEGSLPLRLKIHAAANGAWTGTLMRGDELFDVTLRRTP